LVSVAKAKVTKIDAHLSCGTGGTVQRLSESTHGRDKRKGSHISLPRSIISSESNPIEDIEGEWEKEGSCW